MEGTSEGRKRSTARKEGMNGSKAKQISGILSLGGEEGDAGLEHL